MKRLLLLFVLIPVFSQAQLDSLLQVKAFGSVKEEVLTYCDIAYYAHVQDIPTAIEYGEKAIELANTSGTDSLLAVAFRDASFARMTNGEYEVYLEYSNHSRKLWKQLNMPIPEAKALTNMALAHQELGELDVAMDYYAQAIPIFQEAGDAYTGAILNNNVGNLLGTADRFEESIPYLTKASESFLNAGDTAKYLISGANLSNAWMETGAIAKAEKKYLELYNTPSSSFPASKSETIRGLGVLYSKKGDHSKSARFFQELINLHEDLSTDVGTGYALSRLAAEEIALGKLNEAKYHLDEAAPYFNGQQSFEDLKHYHIQKQRYFEKIGDFKSAYEAQSKVEAYEDSIINEASLKQVIQLEKKLELAEKEQELLQSDLNLAEEQRISNRNKWAFWSTLGFVLLGLITLVFWWRQKKKSQELALKSKEEKAQQEKLRISRDLHDHIGAELTLIKSKIDILAFKSEDPSRKQDLENVSAFSKNAIEQLRKTIWATNREDLSISDFTDELKAYALRFENHTSFHESDSEVLIPSDLALGTFRICQEAIQNAVKYAEGADIAVIITGIGGKLQVMIQDEGPGFDQNKAQGYGLENMRSRAEEMSGTMQIESTSRGTKVHLEIPLK